MKLGINLPASAVPTEPRAFTCLVTLLWYDGPVYALAVDDHHELYLRTWLSDPEDAEKLDRAAYTPISRAEILVITSSTLTMHAVLATRPACIVDEPYEGSPAARAWTVTGADLFHDCPMEGWMLTSNWGDGALALTAEVDEAICDLGGHAPVGSGQCRCGWRGDEER